MRGRFENKNDFEDADKSSEIRCLIHSGASFASQIESKTLQKESWSKIAKKGDFVKKSGWRWEACFGA